MVSPFRHALTGVKVLRFDGAPAPKVLRFDSPSGAEGCGIALTGDEYEVSVTGFTAGQRTAGSRQPIADSGLYPTNSFLSLLHICYNNIDFISM